jgi:flagellar hook protein FlgE
MGYNIGVSGLAATQEAIDVTSNNIANAQTVGYKAGEFVFADQFFRAQDPQSKDRAGMGASRLVVRRNQNFGTLTSTQNALDLAISGIGMFVLAKGVSGTTPTQTPSAFQYTRNGQFAVDSQSRIVNENGMFLVGYPADVNGNISDATFSVLTLDQKPLDAKTSTESTIALNLDSRGEPIDAAFDPTKAVTYSQSTAQTVYDSAGNQHTLSTFYRKVQPATLYFYPKVQGDNSEFQFNTQQNIYATGDANGILPTTFTDLINSSASSIATGATSSATLGIASTSNPGSAATTGAPVETLNGTALIAFPAGQSKTYKMTLNDGTELLVEQEKSSTPGSQLVRYKYVADRFEVYATVDGVNVNGDLSGLSSTSPIQPGYVPAQTPGTVVAPTITTANGQSGATETANVSFGPLTEGQTITLGGLTFTAAKGIVQTSTVPKRDFPSLK